MLVMGTHEQSHSNVNEKNILEVPLFSPLLVPPPFTAYLLNLNYEKSAKCNPTFRQDKFFSSFQNIDKSVSTRVSSRFIFPKEGKELSLSF